MIVIVMSRTKPSEWDSSHTARVNISDDDILEDTQENYGGSTAYTLRVTVSTLDDVLVLMTEVSDPITPFFECDELPIYDQIASYGTGL
jgi:hypothetical protein